VHTKITIQDRRKRDDIALEICRARKRITHIEIAVYGRRKAAIFLARCEAASMFSENARAARRARNPRRKEILYGLAEYWRQIGAALEAAERA
jgi:hypothetical protein